MGAPARREPAPGRFSRTLLLPGPLPPVSHLGATLLRHAWGSGLRYALYHLGLPLPEVPPVRIIELRPYLDAEALERLLAPAAGGAEVAAALVDPGGTGALPAAASRLAGAVRFHRLRLRLARHLPLPRPRSGGRGLQAPTHSFRRRLAGELWRANEGILAELLAALGRRRRRAAGEEVPSCLGPEAHRLRRRGRARLERLGCPDLSLPSWAGTPATARAAAAATAALPSWPADPPRGSYRESWREGLDRLRPGLLDFAAAAAARGLVGAAGDVFFLPLDLVLDLLPDRSGERTPAPGAEGGPTLSWLAPAVAANRREHESLLRESCPPDVLPDLASDATPDLSTGAGPVPELSWEWGPLLPLP